MTLTPPDPKGGKAPTINDVARLAGVSISTVSKAMNGGGQLKEQTRDRVLRAAHKLGFRQDDPRGPLRKRSYTVGLISTDHYGRFSIPLMEGIEDALGAANIHVFLCNAADDPDRERAHVESLILKQVDGIIVTARRTDPRPPLQLASEIPVLYAYAQTHDPTSLCFLPDDEMGGKLAGRHLLKQGRRTIAHITGPQRFEAVQMRLQGLRNAHQEIGLELDESLVIHGSWTEKAGWDAAKQLLTDHPHIDGIFCGSDQIARGVADGLRDLGIHVPEQVALIGFDNWEPLSSATRPPLTTIDMNIHDIGVAAATHLLQLIEGDDLEPGVRRLPCTLIVRESCGGLTH